jgi:hypothetical protein
MNGDVLAFPISAIEIPRFAGEIGQKTIEPLPRRSTGLPPTLDEETLRSSQEAVAIYPERNGIRSC